jgi:spermidine/putrescine transport system permease protein
LAHPLFPDPVGAGFCLQRHGAAGGRRGDLVIQPGGLPAALPDAAAGGGLVQRLSGHFPALGLVGGHYVDHLSVDWLPMAFFIVLQRPSVRNIYMLLVLIPFWTNFLVRTYAWKFILNNNGLLNSILPALELPRVAMINTPTAVLIGLVYGSMPFMVLPLYASIEKLDFNLIEAAQDLGANYWRVLTRVVLPVTMPGIIAGTILVFSRHRPIYRADHFRRRPGGHAGQLLAQQFGPAGNWPFGSAIAVIFMLLLMVGVAAYLRSEENRREDEPPGS